MYDEALCIAIENEEPDPYETLVGINIDNPSEDELLTMLESTMQRSLSKQPPEGKTLVTVTGRLISEYPEEKVFSTSGNNLKAKNETEEFKK